VSKKVTTEEFIKRGRAIHGDKYDYSRTVYIAAIQHVTITCPIHGEFQQRPVNHLMGRGCPHCGGSKALTLEKFIERANLRHGKRYNYSLVKFDNVESKIEIICSKHGSFKQRVMSHLKGFNCPACGSESKAEKLKQPFDEFLLAAKATHGDKYNYSKVNYINAQTKVKIICPEHGLFLQRPVNHIRDIGCSKCSHTAAGLERRLSTEEFIRRAKLVHSDKYDYSNVNYTTAHEKVEILCKEHGSFWQSPASHTMGNKAGCPGCAISGFDQTKPGILYYLAVLTDNNETLYKIGITNLSVEKRFPNVDLARIRTIRTWPFKEGTGAAKRELSILKEYSDDLYCGPDVLIGSGNTELFVRDVLQLDLDGDTQEYKQHRQLRFEFKN
jgi:Zn finger protein HypA/HybF involved in hydrogenase expression